MKTQGEFSGLEPGYDVPALPGMTEAEIQTPCLVLDLDALEANLRTMGNFARAAGISLRVHGKMHKSVDVARLQHEIGGASGICCQKVSEAEAFARGGIADILVSNEVTDPAKIDRLARLPKLGALGTRIGVCVDDLSNVTELSAAAVRHDTALHCLVEVDSGANRCGVSPGPELVALAKAIIAAPGLTFDGIQAYQGAMQHIADFSARRAAFEASLDIVRQALAALEDEGIPCPAVTGGGTGSYAFEAGSGIYTELQCGSYAFMDAAYRTVRDEHGATMPEFSNALFILTSIMSHAKPDRAVCDAGLKVQSVDSGLPVIFGRKELTYLNCSDEHGVIADPGGVLKLNERLKLVPGHCDPTCNLHDWYVGVRAGKVECLWPVSARGKNW